MVYTWVNTNDPHWKALKNKYYINKPNIDNDPKRWSVYNDPANELKLSIESVRMHLPWVRNILVITQRPQRISEEFLKKYNVKIIYHDQIIEPKYLPTFSSVAIETSLHKIPNLSERFIYFNDDNYINHFMKPNDFFIHNKPIFRTHDINTNSYNIFEMPSKEVHNQQMYNSKKALSGYFYVPIHQATPLTKQIMKNAEHHFHQQWQLTKTQKFRTGDSIIPVYLALNYANQLNLTSRPPNNFIKELFIENEIDKINKHYHLVCVNNKSNMELLRQKILNNTL